MSSREGAAAEVEKTGPQQRKWIWQTREYIWYPLFFLSPAVILFCCQLATLQSVQAVFRWLGGSLGAAAFTYCLLLSAIAVVVALSESLFLGTLLVGVPALLLSLASHFKEVVNGVPLLVSDLAMAGNAGEIAGFLRPGIDLGAGTWWAVGLLVLFLAAAALFAHRTRAQRRGWYGRTVAGLLAVLVLVSSAQFPPAAALLAGPGEEVQAERNDRLGLLAGVYSGILDSSVQQPDAYTENNMNAILRQAGPGEYTAPQVQPNVVLIMSESFCDPTAILPNVDFLEDPIPNYHALEKEWPSGYFLSNNVSCGTGAVELEVLTGLPSYFLSEGEDLTSIRSPSAYGRLPSIVKTFAGAGYATEFVHSYTARLYNRSRNMPAIGFQKVLFEADFPADAERSGPYLSDMALTDMLIHEFEHKEAGKPILLYGLSMENHQPYFAEKFPEGPAPRFASDQLTEAAAGSVEALLYGLHGADAALGALLDYFEDCEEPVLVVFWGDHLPGLALDPANTVYSILGYNSTANTLEWSPEELKKMHTTRFLVWNNYGAELRVPETISTLAMGTHILDWAGVPKPLYFRWVDRALEHMCTYRPRLFIAGDGTARHAPAPGTQEEKTAQEWEMLVYDIVYGAGYTVKALSGK